MMQRIGPEQKIIYTLRLACALCFIGHGAFGIITKAVWCNYFGVFGIGQHTAYSLMPVVGMIDILFGAVILFYPLRGAFAWLVIWGTFTALLRPLSGEPLAEFIERAGNYGAPFVLLLTIALSEKMRPKFSSVLSSNLSLEADDWRKITLALRVAAFLLLLGHGWLNLLAKKGLVDQYASFGFSSPHLICEAIGSAEVAAAILVLLRPSPAFVLLLFVWKMASELFYPHYEFFEWIERGGSYGVLLALWLSLRQKAAEPSKTDLHQTRFEILSY